MFRLQMKCWKGILLCQPTVRKRRATEHSCPCHLHWSRAVNCKCVNKERWVHNWCLVWGFVSLVDRIKERPCVQTIPLCSRPIVRLIHTTAYFEKRDVGILKLIYIILPHRKHTVSPLRNRPLTCFLESIGVYLKKKSYEIHQSAL